MGCRWASISAIRTATGWKSPTNCRANEWPRQDAVFAPDVVNLGRFPGPWDAEMRAREAAEPVTV